MRYFVSITLATSLCLPAGLLHAQDTTVTVSGGVPRGLFAGLSAEIIRPEPDLRSYIGHPTGVAGHVTVPVWTSGNTSFGIRGDAFWVRHYHKDVSAAVSVAREFYGGLIGPQISVASGPFRPYVAAGYGTTRYWTVLRVDEDCDPETDPSCEQDRVRGSDYEASTVLTGGVYIRLSGSRTTVPVLLHLSGSYHRGGTPDVRTLRDGTTPGRPDSRYRGWQIGLSVGGR
jgi:hypothetical protein